MYFKKWLNEVGTSTSAVAVFARPIFSEPVRRKKKKLLDEAFSSDTPVWAYKDWAKENGERKEYFEQFLKWKMEEVKNLINKILIYKKEYRHAHNVLSVLVGYLWRFYELLKKMLHQNFDTKWLKFIIDDIESNKYISGDPEVFYTEATQLLEKIIKEIDFFEKDYQML